MGKGKSILGIVGAAFGFMNPAIFGFASTAVWSGALYGLSLGTTIWSATHKPSNATVENYSRFDTFMNSVDSTARIPVIYGTRKFGGLQSYHLASSDGKKLTKDIIISEGEVQGVYGVTANELTITASTSNTVVSKATSKVGSWVHSHVESTHVFSLVNLKYADATVQIVEGGPTPGDKTLKLYANRKTTSILLQHPSDLHNNHDNDYSCYMSKLVNYIGGIGYTNTLADEGWKVVAASITTDPPENIGTMNTANCYNNPVSIGINRLASPDSRYVFNNGATIQSPPDNYMAVGGYRKMAWLRANLVQSEQLAGGNPNIAYVCQGMKIWDTRTNTKEYSENPAMIVRDYLLSKTYGCGHFITADMLDEDAFKEVADYCDELVTYVDHNGITVTEPRYTLNIILDTKKKHVEHLQDIFANFGGFLVFTNNHISLRVERSTESSYDFTDDTIVGGSVTYTANTVEQTPNRYNITYYDPTQNWTGVKCLVENTVNQQPYPVGRGKIIPKDVVLTGCTRQSQALRLGRLFRDLAILCPIVATWQTATMAMHLEPGDVVTITKNIIVNGESQVLFDKMPFRILEISNNKGIWTIKGQQYNDSIYHDGLGAKIVVKNYVPIANPLSSTVPDVVNLNIRENFRELGNGVVTSDARVTWTSIDTFYKEAEVYVLSDNPTWSEIETSLNDLDGTWESIGNNSGSWKLVGKAINELFMTNLVKGLTYTFKVVSVNSVNRKATFDTAPEVSILIKGKTYTPSTPRGLQVSITDKCEWSWNQMDLDCDFAELRTDINTGNITGLLVKTSSTKAISTPPSRHGVAYLYAHNTAGYYSDPCVLEYNKVAPSAPANVTLTDVFQGVVVITEVLPLYCLGINVHINDGTGDKVFYSPNNSYTFKTTGGIYDIQVAFVDIFGEGAKSAVVENVVRATIDPALLAAESLSLEKMDAVIKDAVEKAKVSVSGTVFNDKVNQLTQVDENHASQITQQAQQITQVVTGLNNAYTAIAQTDAAVQLRATKDNIIGIINVSPETITIASKFNHVAGDTLIDDNVIVGRMMQSESVLARHMSTEALNLTASGKTLNAGNVKLDSTGMKVSEATGAYTKFDSNGISWVDSNGNPSGAIRRLVTGTVASGKYIRLNWQYAPQVLLSPYDMLTSNVSGSFTKIRLIPESVTPTGFRVRGYIVQSAGSSGTFSLDYPDASTLTAGYFKVLGTTPPNTGQINANWYSWGHFLNTGGFDIGFYYRRVGSTSWILGGRYGFGVGGCGGENGTIFVTPSQLGTPGQFEIAVGIISPSNTISHHGGWNITYIYGETIVEDPSTRITFIATESSQNTGYTIED